LLAPEGLTKLAVGRSKGRSQEGVAMNFRSFARVVLATASLLVAASAQAGLVWSYSYSGAGVSGSGYLATTGALSGGAYTITGISGTLGTAPVESLLAPGTYTASGGGLLFSDNLLYPGTPALGLGGFTVQAGSDLYNIYNTGGSYYQLAGADCGAANCGQPGHLGTSIVFSASLVPSIDWTFVYSGAGVNASGTITTLATPVGGGYQIVGLSGTRNGQNMNALFPAGVYSASGGGLLLSDDLLFASEPHLTIGGFTFHAGDDRYNVYDDGGQYYDLAGIDCGGSTCGQPGHLGTPISFAVNQVPEPGTLALAGMALFGLFGTKRLRAVLATVCAA